jgi:NifU-like protein involved in Fe-S cluster formation
MMYYKSMIVTVAGAIALSGVAPALADSQLIASAGLTVEQAEGMTLTEIAQHKFNREESSADRWNPSIPVVTGTGDHTQLAASAGLGSTAAHDYSLTELAAAKFNNDTRSDDRQRVVRSESVIVATRSADGATSAHAQLIASAGLTPAEAKGMSLSEIAQYKFDRDVSGADR